MTWVSPRTAWPHPLATAKVRAQSPATSWTNATHRRFGAIVGPLCCARHYLARRSPRVRTNRDAPTCPAAGASPSGFLPWGGKLLSPAKRRRAVERVCSRLDVSERRACRVLGQARSTQRREPKIGEDEDELVARMTQLGSEYGRYGYLRITALRLELRLRAIENSQRQSFPDVDFDGRVLQRVSGD